MQTIGGRNPYRGLSVTIIIIIATIMVLTGRVSALGTGGKGPVSPPATRSWSGYLLDGECARERKTEIGLGPKHTTKCLQMPACDRSGFGLLTDRNEYLRFDENGNRQVRELISKARIQDNWRIVVQGRRSGDALQVQKIKIRPGSK